MGVTQPDIRYQEASPGLKAALQTPKVQQFLRENVRTVIVERNGKVGTVIGGSTIIPEISTPYYEGHQDNLAAGFLEHLAELAKQAFSGWQVEEPKADAVGEQKARYAAAKGLVEAVLAKASGTQEGETERLSLLALNKGSKHFVAAGEFETEPNSPKRAEFELYEVPLWIDGNRSLCVAKTERSNPTDAHHPRQQGVGMIALPTEIVRNLRTSSPDSVRSLRQLRPRPGGISSPRG